MSEEESLDRVVTFFEKNKKSGALKEICTSRRAIIIAMLKSNEPMFNSQISRRADVPPSVVYETTGTFVRAGLARRVPVAIHRARQDSKYELTAQGVEVALGVSYEEKQVLDLDYKALFQRILQSRPAEDPYAKLTDSYLTQVLERGLVKYLVEFVSFGVQAAERASLMGRKNVEWRTMPMGVGSLLGERKEAEEKILIDCLMSAVASLSEEDRYLVLQDVKNNLVQGLFNMARITGNRALLSLAARSQSEPDVLLLPLKCECGHYEERHLRMYEILLHAYALKKYNCSRCGQIVNTDKRIVD